MSRILVTLLPWFYCGGRGVLLMLLYTVLQILASAHQASRKAGAPKAKRRKKNYGINISIFKKL